MYDRKENILMGYREFLVQDPNGYLLRFRRHKSIEIVSKNRTL